MYNENKSIRRNKERKKSVNLSNNIQFNQKIKHIISKGKTPLLKKKTLNYNLNVNKNMNIFVLNKKKNKFLKKLKIKLKYDFHNYSESIDNQKQSIKEEREASFIFIEKKINQWMSEASIKLKESQKNLIINDDENIKKNIEKDTKIMSIDLIKKNKSLNDFSFIYFKYHKGNLDISTLSYIKYKFFEISFPFHLFQKDNNSNPRKSFRLRILQRNSAEALHIDNFNTLTLSRRKSKRISNMQMMKYNLLNKLINYPLNDKDKKYILYFYYLDLNKTTDDNYDNINIEEPNNILEILKKDNNSIEFQDLIKNKFIYSYKSRTKQNSNKKEKQKNANSFKTKTFKLSNVIKKNTENNTNYNNKTHVFHSTFFKRKGILNSSKSKGDNLYNKRKTLLEYNLLFDPNLIQYNNLINDIQSNKKSFKQKSNHYSSFAKSKDLKDKLFTSLLMSSGGMKTDKNIIVMKTLDLKNKYTIRNRGNVKSLISSIKDCNYQSFVKFYKVANCGPNAKDKEGNTLLSLAVKSCCIEIVDFLLKEKADPNIPNVRKYYIYLF